MSDDEEDDAMDGGAGEAGPSGVKREADGSFDDAGELDDADAMI